MARITAGDDVRDRNRRTCSIEKGIYIKRKKSSLYTHIYIYIYCARTLTVEERLRRKKPSTFYKNTGQLRTGLCVYVYYIRDCYLAHRDRAREREREFVGFLDVHKCDVMRVFFVVYIYIIYIVVVFAR